MNIYKTSNYDEMSKKAASIISAQIILKPDSLLGLATGSSPIGTYQNLVKWYNNGDLDFSKIKTVNLDEYRGLTKENDQSYAYFMNYHLFSHVNILTDNVHIPDGMEKDSQKAGEDYEKLISSLGNVDLQLLGLGHNGHIGFNEPAEEFPVNTHVVDLQESTIQANKRFFESIEQVPRQAYTMGIGTIMRAKKILLIVSGEEKADVIAKALKGPVTPHVPASILQMHPDVTVVGDEAALSKL